MKKIRGKCVVPWMIWHGITQNRHLPDINLPDPCETWCHFCGFDVCTGLPKKALNTSLINHKWFNVNHFVDKLINSLLQEVIKLHRTVFAWTVIRTSFHLHLFLYDYIDSNFNINRSIIVERVSSSPEKFQSFLRKTLWETLILPKNVWFLHQKSKIYLLNFKKEAQNREMKCWNSQRVPVTRSKMLLLLATRLIFELSPGFSVYCNNISGFIGVTTVSGYLKLLSTILYQIFIFSPNDSPSKIMQKVFYFI